MANNPLFAFITSLEGYLLFSFNLETKEIVKKVSLPGAPQGTIIPPGKNHLYVLLNNRQIIPYSLPNLEPGQPILLDTPPVSIVSTPDGATLYVFSLTNMGAFLIPITTATNAKSAPIALPASSLNCPGSGNTTAIAMGSDSKTVYYGANQPGTNLGVFSITPATGAINNLGFDATVRNIAVTPDNKKAYLATDKGFIYSFTFSTKTIKLVLTGSVSCGAGEMVFSPDGKTLYAVFPASNWLAFIDTETDFVPNAVTVSPDPRSVALVSDGTMAYVASYKGRSITPVDLIKRQSLISIPLSIAPQTINVAPGVINAAPVAQQELPAKIEAPPVAQQELPAKVDLPPVVNKVAPAKKEEQVLPPPTQSPALPKKKKCQKKKNCGKCCKRCCKKKKC